MKQQFGFTTTELVVFILILAGFGGWVANIVKLIYMLNDPITAMFVARVVGIFAAPFGAILGYF